VDTSRPMRRSIVVMKEHIGQHSRNYLAETFRIFRSCKMVSTDVLALAAICFTVKRRAVCHNHLFHSHNLVFRSASAWPRLLRFVFTQHSAFCELSYPRTQIFHILNAIIACLTQLLMNFDGLHSTHVEESDNHALFFACKCRHFQYLKHYCHSTMSQAFNG
jgi:hypothetical protein